MRVNAKFEYKENERECLALFVQSRDDSQGKQLTPIIQSQKPIKTALREKPKVRFHELTYIEQVPIPAKSSDGQVKGFHLLIRKE